MILEELKDNGEQTLFELCTRLIMEHTVDMTRHGVSTHSEVLEVDGLIASTGRGKFKLPPSAGINQIKAAATWPARLAENDTDTGTERS